MDEVVGFSLSDGDTIVLHGLTSGDIATVVNGGSTYIVFSDGAGGYLEDAAIRLTVVTADVSGAIVFA